MSNNEKEIKPIKNKLWTIISTIIKSIILLVIIGIIMCVLSDWGAREIYTKKTSNRSYYGWTSHENLNPIYGVGGIIIYIAINCFSFLSYNYEISKFKNYKIVLGKVMYIIFSIYINIFMIIMYTGIFSSYSFENNLLNFLNREIIEYGFITFPTIFVIIYIIKNNSNKLNKNNEDNEDKQHVLK